MDTHKRSIYLKFLAIIVFPMFAMGLIIVFIATGAFTRSMHHEIEIELANLANTVVDAYDRIYPGDYTLVGKEQVAVLKGDKVVSANTEFIDGIREKCDVHVSVFYYNTRVATTITDGKGNRLNQTVVNLKVEEDVVKGEKESFYNNAMIDDVRYYAYYIPLYNSNNKCVGMISVAKPYDEVQSKIGKSILPIIIISLITMIVAAIITMFYTKHIIGIIGKLRRYINKVASGKLDSEPDADIISRNDEFGDIAASVSEMRNSLKEVVEIDSLTRVYNRRCGEIKLKQTIENSKKQGIQFALAIGDIDFFKKVNDTYGHECGDEVLKAVAKELKKLMVGKGYVCRWGGEEFLFIFDKLDYDRSLIALNDIRSKIENLDIDYNETKMRVTMTFGIVEGNTTVEIHHQIKIADDKLYVGKQRGRNMVVN
ncbi:MAG: diguanylate cyclase [Lachnospiraceae bacterium]|nr:diguanylate cyclase [Lachnospiraceae bacterium]